MTRLKDLTKQRRYTLLSIFIFIILLFVGPYPRTFFIFLDKPAVWLEKKGSDYLYLFRSKKSLFLENERLREKYFNLLARCNSPSPPKKEEIPQFILNNYWTARAKVMVVRGGDLVAEIPFKKPLYPKGVVLFHNWLIGDWQGERSSSRVTVNLWFQPQVPLRVKITDDKGLFISGGILKVEKGKLVLDQVLRGVELKSGEFLYLLSAEYDNFPPLGLTKKMLAADAVYQKWSVELPWEKSIRVDSNLVLVSVRGDHYDRK